MLFAEGDDIVLQSLTAAAPLAVPSIILFTICIVGVHMYVKIDKDSFEVIILTVSLRIEGIIHTLPQERLTDFMTESTHSYLPVTDASIYKLSDGALIAKTRFLSLNRKDVTLISPMSEVSK